MINTFPTSVPGYESRSVVGSGVLIDANHVLTAGHLVYSIYENEKDWATTIRVISTYHDGEKPYGESQSINMYCPTPWIKNKDKDWDIAFMELDRPVGGIVGWHGYGYNNNDTFFALNYLTILVIRKADLMMVKRCTFGVVFLILWM